MPHQTVMPVREERARMRASTGVSGTSGSLGSNVIRSWTPVLPSSKGRSVRSCSHRRMLSIVDFSWNRRHGSSSAMVRSS